MGSSTRNTAIISREYKDAPDYCARALELLLRKPASKKGGSATAPVDRKGLKNDPARTKLTR